MHWWLSLNYILFSFKFTVQLKSDLRLIKKNFFFFAVNHLVKTIHFTSQLIFI